MNEKFPFTENDHLECVTGDDLVAEGRVCVAHMVSRPGATLYQWVLVDIDGSPGRREWLPADRFRRL